MSLPRRQPGRPTPAARGQYESELRDFAGRLLEINSALEFQVSSRGWCYILENQGEITKGDFDAAQRTINDCRKCGLLPLDICAEDDRRTAYGIERLDGDVEYEVEAWWDSVRCAANAYTPVSFWEGQEYYLELAVEKIDLKNLFAPDELGLTWIDNLETGSGKRLDDPRHSDHRKPYVIDYLKRFGARKVEANALIVRPAQGRDLCRRAIEQYISADAPSRYNERLTTHRAELRNAMRQRFGVSDQP